MNANSSHIQIRCIPISLKCIFWEKKRRHSGLNSITNLRFFSDTSKNFVKILFQRRMQFDIKVRSDLYTVRYYCKMKGVQSHRSLVLPKKFVSRMEKMQKLKFIRLLLSWLDWNFDLHKFFFMFSLFLCVWEFHLLLLKWKASIRENYFTLNGFMT